MPIAGTGAAVFREIVCLFDKVQIMGMDVARALATLVQMSECAAEADVARAEDFAVDGAALVEMEGYVARTVNFGIGRGHFFFIDFYVARPAYRNKRLGTAQLVNLYVARPAHIQCEVVGRRRG